MLSRSLDVAVISKVAACAELMSQQLSKAAGPNESLSGIRLQDVLVFVYRGKDSQRVQVSLWYILRPPKHPISIYHIDTWTLWDC